MTFRAFLSAVLVTGLWCTCAAAQNVASMPDRAVVLDTEHNWRRAVERGNTADVEKFIADDFIGVESNGKSYSKAEWLTFKSKSVAGSSREQNVKSGRGAGIQGKIRIYGNVAVVNGWYAGARGVYFLDVWVKTNDTWKIVGLQNMVIGQVH